LPEGEIVLKKLQAKYRARKVLGISAATGAGMDALLDRLITELSKAPASTQLVEIPESRLIKVDTGFRVENMGGGNFKLAGLFVERAAAMLDATLPEALDRFQR